jgi:hydrogenase expression/formation protein HypE
MSKEMILIGHGSGGRMSHDLIKRIFYKHFSNVALNAMGDSALVTMELNNICYTTDSYVVDPIFFPGGDIGKLAISGTVNDLCVSGAIPKFLTAGFILEEGLSIDDLEKIVVSMANEAKIAGIQIVAGDTKVVKRGQCDKLFINTSGIGILPANRQHLANTMAIIPGDKILVSGSLGDHAIAILAAREKLTVGGAICSDAYPLNNLTEKVLEHPEDIRFMRDITRGGLATVLAECAESMQSGIMIYENELPIKTAVRSVCEIYGFDPLYLANEGKIMLVVKGGQEEKILRILHADSKGLDARIIGEVTNVNPGQVIIESMVGGRRIVDMLNGEMLPRIC